MPFNVDARSLVPWALALLGVVEAVLGVVGR
jgi:hypothetical protein